MTDARARRRRHTRQRSAQDKPPPSRVGAAPAGDGGLPGPDVPQCILGCLMSGGGYWSRSADRQEEQPIRGQHEERAEAEMRFPWRQPTLRKTAAAAPASGGRGRNGGADCPVRAKRPRGPPCAGGPDMGTSGSKARGLWPFASAAGGGGPEAVAAEQALVRPRGRVVPPFVFTRRG